MKYSALGTVAGVAVGWLPGLSTASANSVLASLIGYEKNRRTYILATSAANTSNAFIGLAALFALSRMRNGVMVAISELPLPTMSELTVIGVLAACAAYGITVVLSRSASRLNGIDGRLLNRAVIAFIVILCIDSHGSVRCDYSDPCNCTGTRAASGKCPEGFLHGRDYGACHTLLFWHCMDLIS